VSFAIGPTLDADELEDVIWMVVERDGIEPTTSSMPLSWTRFSDDTPLITRDYESPLKLARFAYLDFQ
jgi:hypothetical protein